MKYLKKSIQYTLRHHVLSKLDRQHTHTTRETDKKQEMIALACLNIECGPWLEFLSNLHRKCFHIHKFDDYIKVNLSKFIILRLF